MQKRAHHVTDEPRLCAVEDMLIEGAARILSSPEACSRRSSGQWQRGSRYRRR